ncbi:MAG: N-acetylmuramoyl-L-alanine amidase [Cyclobacteriaceae bacterium]
MEFAQLTNEFKHHGPRLQVDGIVIHSMAKYFHRFILREKPYNISSDLVSELPEIIFAPDFLEFVGKNAKQSWLKGSADSFIERHGIGYRYGYDKQTWHSGVSQWKNWKNLNKNFLGLELLLGDKPFNDYGHFINEINNNESLYTEPMYQTLAYECIRLMNVYNLDISNIVTHEMVAGDHIRGKGKGKQDPGRAFNWNYFISLLSK